MNLHGWFKEHSLKLLAIRDTPEAIAGGVAIGIFVGFTPLWGLKTLLAIFFAWLTRSNIIAAVIAGSLHDVILPLMPVIYRWEYDLGYRMIHQEWPQHLTRANFRPSDWRELRPVNFQGWMHVFTDTGKPLLLGSIIIGAPVAAISYFVAKYTVARHQRKKLLQPQPPQSPAV